MKVFVSCRKRDDITEDADPLFLNSHPEVVYQVIQSVFFGALALTALRFKFLWTPHMCLFAAGIFCNQYFWKTALTKIGLKEIWVSRSLFVYCSNDSLCKMQEKNVAGSLNLAFFPVN